MIDVLWEAEGLVIVSKPFGLATQSTQRGEPTLEDWLMRRYRRVHLPHRLDQTASGLILAVRDPGLDGPIAALFAQRRIARTYLAVLAGDALTVGEDADWHAPIDGKPAQSHARIVGASQGLLAAVLTLGTGRTHQLRRHAAGASVPIVGDRRYGGAVGAWAPRLALHAARLQFQHPRTGHLVDVRSPLPPPLDTIWRAAGGPAEASLA